MSANRARGAVPRPPSLQTTTTDILRRDQTSPLRFLDELEAAFAMMADSDISEVLRVVNKELKQTYAQLRAAEKVCKEHHSESRVRGI